MNNLEKEARLPDNEIPKIPTLALNNPDRRVYSNGELLLQFSLDENDASWNVFRQFAANPLNLINKASLLRFIPVELDLQEEIKNIESRLTNKAPNVNIIEKVLIKDQVVGFKLNARVVIVKL